MSLAQADRLTALIEKHQVRDILELGFAHGVSTAYMAAALGRIGGGSIVTIDREDARHRDPNIETLLARVGESDRVKIHYEPKSYNWTLMKFLEQQPRPQFDLCYLDGAHNWYVDGLAFFLVDLLLRPGGWIILDDIDWTYDRSPSLKESNFVKDMPDEERKTPQVRKVYELLVKPHPGYCNFRIDEDWAYAQKKVPTDNNPSQREIIVETVVKREYYGIGSFLDRLLRRVFK